MATRPDPADLPFATDATFAADGDDWSGDPTKVDPGASRVAEGFEPDTLPAEWLNWQLNLLGQATEWAVTLLDANEEHTYQTPKTRKTVVSLWDGISPDGFWSHVATALPGSANYWWESANPYAQLVFPLNQYLRDGMTIEAVRVIMDPTAANASSGDRMSFLLAGANPNFGTPATVTPTTIGSVRTDDGTAAIQTRTQNYGNTIVRAGDSALDYYLLILSANEASGDRIYGIEIEVTDPGPRNV